MPGSGGHRRPQTQFLTKRLLAQTSAQQIYTHASHASQLHQFLTEIELRNLSGFDSLYIVIMITCFCYYCYYCYYLPITKTYSYSFLLGIYKLLGIIGIQGLT